jgi:hypothetical protein
VYVLQIVVSPFIFYFQVAIVLSVLLRYTDYDYPFGIFKLFLKLSLTIPETTTYDVENLESGLGQVQKGGGVKPVNGTPPPFPSSLDSWISIVNTNV